MNGDVPQVTRAVPPVPKKSLPPPPPGKNPTNVTPAKVNDAASSIMAALSSTPNADLPGPTRKPLPPPPPGSRNSNGTPSGVAEMAVLFSSAKSPPRH